MKERKVVIFGAGGHGKVVLDILLESGVNVTGFIDEDKNKSGKKVCGVSVIGDWSVLRCDIKPGIAVGIGDNLVREKIFRKAKGLGLIVISALHPKAVISKDVKIGEGVVIMAGAVVNPGTVLEDGVVVNTGASVDHDCCLGRFSQVLPGANIAGTVNIGEFSSVGMGAVVIHNINVGKNSIIGAGAVVIRDIPDNVTAFGVPAKIIENKK
jgi:sugar O-acyltransferase (sialic acid O-acetyltransferase NeuD family)